MAYLYTSDYLEFIHQFITQKVNIEFQKIIYEESVSQNISLQEWVIDNQDNTEIWEQVFTKLYDPLQYYHEILYTLKTNNLETLEKLHDIHNVMTTITGPYTPIHFKDYVDSQVNLKKVGAYDYQRFIKSMQDITFYNNIFQKYQTQEQLKKVKNLIINAIIQENQHQPQSFLDIIPYLEYASMKTYNTDINVPLEMERILELENKTHQLIDEWIK